jgi:hypothetical protein
MALSARPGLHLADFVIALAPSGNPAPLTGTLIRATPSVIPLFVKQADSSYVPATEPTEVVTVAGDGSWSLVLPAQSDCQPTTVTWTLTLPDGSSYSGAVTDAMVTASQLAPLSVHDLTATYAWGIVVSAVTPVVTLQGAKGEPGTGVQIKGAYNPALGYVVNDVVSFTAPDTTVSTYVAVQTVPPGTAPPNSTYWTLFVSAGIPGTPGATADATTSVVGGALINRAPPGAHPVVPVLTSGGLVNAADLSLGSHSAAGIVKPGNSLQVSAGGLIDVTQEISLLTYGTNVGTGSNVADEAAMDAWLLDTTHLTLFIPEGTYHWHKAYNIGSRGIRGAGMGRTIILCETPLGAVNAITAGFTGTFKLVMSDGLSLMTPLPNGTPAATFTTGLIPVYATAAEVHDALAALACVPLPTDISVTGLDGGPWTVTYQGSLAGRHFDPLVVLNRNSSTPPNGYAIGPYVATTLIPGNDTTTPLGSKPEIHSALTQIGGVINSVTYNQVETLQPCLTPLPYLTVTGDSHIGYLRDLSFFGPSQGVTTLSGARGQKLAHVDGVYLFGQIEMRDVVVGGFDYGVILANFTGHEVLKGVQSRGNYYGIYDIFDGGDVYFENCLLDSNLMATLGVGPDNVNGLSAATFIHCHLAGAPYVFYGEYRNIAWQMLADVTLINSPFEAVGNGIVYSEGWDVTTDPTKLRAIQSLHVLDRSGFYWDGGHRLPLSRANWNYAFQVGDVLGYNRIVDDYDGPIVKGQLGTWYINAMSQGRLEVYSGSWNPNTSGGPSDHDVTGNSSRFYYWRVNANMEGTATIVAGQTFIDVTQSAIPPNSMAVYLGPNVRPQVTAMNDPVIGSVAGTPFALMVTNIVSTPGTATSFRISILGGAPTVNLTVAWKVR